MKSNKCSKPKAQIFSWPHLFFYLLLCFPATPHHETSWKLLTLFFLTCPLNSCSVVPAISFHHSSVLVVSEEVLPSSWFSTSCPGESTTVMFPTGPASPRATQPTPQVSISTPKMAAPAYRDIQMSWRQKLLALAQSFLFSCIFSPHLHPS